jgi:hypothetical protein
MSLYPSSGATIRSDINAVVEEAAGADSFFIGDRVMPQYGVDAKSGTYPKLEIAGGELLTKASTVRQPTGSYGEISRAWTYDTYDCVDRGLEAPVDDTTQKDLSRFFNVEASQAKWCLRNMKLDHESRVATAVMNATTFGAGTSSSVAYTEALIATLNFPLDVLAAIERVRANGQNPNTVVMSSAVYNRVRRGTLTQSWVAGSVNKGAIVTADTIAQSLASEGITQVLVGRSYYNSANKGQTKSMSAVWGNTYVWVGVVNNGARDLRDGGSGFTLVWNAEGGLWVSETYRDEKRRSNMVRVRQNTTEKVVDATAGTLITTQYS